MIRVINPNTGDVLQTYSTLSDAELETTLAHSAAAYQDWRHRSVADRTALLRQLAEQLRQNTLIYAKLITVEMGKPLTQAQAEVQKCARLAEYYADHAESLLATQTVATEARKSYYCFEPQGTVLGVMPWNFPFWQALRFAIPTVAAGNTALLKHAPNSTGAAIALAELFTTTGFPEGVFQSAIVEVTAVPKMIADPRIIGVSFTGSDTTGRLIAEWAGAALKKVVLELGGNDPFLILEDADLALAVEHCILSRLSNAGQTCVAAKRIIAVAEVYAEFEERLVERARSYVCGDPLEPSTLLGPMAREDLRDRFTKQIDASVQEGARCLLGGKPLIGPGFFYPATVLSRLNSTMTPARAELFGPSLNLFEVPDEATAIRVANTTQFGLGGAVFTRDLIRGERIARTEIQTGTCMVNGLVSSDPRLPFGGIKHSGFGRELSAYGLHEFCNIKTIVVR